jgi:TetR/AcrR family transcriptional regulator, transcriptional repressor for nem operon
MPPQSTLPDTRARLIDAAVYLFWEQGYAATGVSEILARAKVNSGSFYHFFKSKETLLLAVLDWYLIGLDPFVMQPAFAQSPDPIERIFAVLAFYRQNLIKTACTYGCPIGRLALEIPEDRTAVHHLLAANFDGWTAAIEACLDAARDRLPEDLDRASLSQFVLTVMEGGVMQSRAHRDLAPFDASVRHLRRYFGLLTQPPQSARIVAPPRPLPRTGGPRKSTHRPQTPELP